jgi:UDP-N-acetylglucosamine 2-epimerase (non-hydrolysing)
VKRVAVVWGTRPDVIKLAPVVLALRSSSILEPVVISSGQHRELHDQASLSFGITPDVSLELMEHDQSLAALTGRLLPALEGAIVDSGADFVVVQGDTATMLAAALAAFYGQRPIGHVEAGLRTGDLRAPFPEEANRRLVTPLVDLNFAPTQAARDNLLAEGVPPEKVILTGNTVVDALHQTAARQQSPAELERLLAAMSTRLGEGWAAQQIVLVTVHRRESIGGALAGILDAVAELAGHFADHLFCLPVHLNPNVEQAVGERLGGIGNVRLMEPLGHDEFVFLLRHCRLVMTDSGGVQEEAPVFGKPVVVMRETTERPEGIAAGVAVLAGVDGPAIAAATARLLSDEASYRRMAQAASPYGDGRAAERIVSSIERFLG